MSMAPAGDDGGIAACLKAVWWYCARTASVTDDVGGDQADVIARFEAVIRFLKYQLCLCLKMSVIGIILQ